jgi:hypothetical protein
MTHLKKLALIVLGLAMVLCPVFGAGSSESPAAPAQSTSSGTPSSTSPAAAPVQIRFATSLSASSGHVYGAGMATVINKHSKKVNINAFASSGVVENDRLLRSDNAQIIMHGSGQLISSYAGTDAYEGKPFSEARLLWYAYPVYMNFVVPMNSPIKSIGDLKGKRLGTGNAGSTTFVQVEQILDLWGMSYKDVRPQPLSLNEQVSALKDGNIDGFGTLMGANIPGLVDLSLSRDVRWLSVPDDKWELIKQKYPKGYYSRAIIPAGMYKGLDQDVPTVAGMNMWVTTSAMTEEVAYEITKAFWDNKAEADAIHPIIGQTPLVLVEDEMPIPLHPGARRYFLEKGMLK